MLLADLVVSAEHRTLKKRSGAFNTVRVRLAAHPFVSTVRYPIMRSILGGQIAAGGTFVDANRLGVLANVLADELPQRLTVDAFGCLDSQIAAALNRTESDRLIHSVSPSLTPNLPADVCLIDFDHAPHEGAGGLKRRTHAMAEIPCRLVGHLQRALKLVGAHAFLALYHHVNAKKPLPERKVSIVHDRAGRCGKLIAATVAIKLTALLNAGYRLVGATRASDPVRPTKLFKVRAALVLATKVLD